jgi:CBS-domain-containing membrane protein
LTRQQNESPESGVVQNVRVNASLVAPGRCGFARTRWRGRCVYPGMPPTVADIMNKKLLYIRVGDRPSLARGKLLEFGVTAVPVLDDEHRPAGLVSLRDLAHADDGQTVTEPVRVVRGGATVEEGARILAEHGTHQLVVVDEGGHAIGMVSAVDFVRGLLGVPAEHPHAFDRY